MTSPPVRHLQRVAEALRKDLPKEIAQVSQEAVARMRRSFKPYGRPVTTETLYKRSSNLMRALRKQVTVQPTGRNERDITAIFNVDPSNRKAKMQAEVQEFGKERIRPVNAKKLLIPVGPLRSRNGVALVDSMAEVRALFDVRVLEDVVLGRKKGTKDKWQVVAVRRKWVNIRARPFAAPQVEWAYREIGKQIGAVLADAS